MNVDHDGVPNGARSPSPALMNSSFAPSINLLTPGTDATTVFATLLRVDVHRPTTDTSAFPIKAFLTDFLSVLKAADTNNVLLPVDDTSPDGVLSMESDIPTGDTIRKYVTGIQSLPMPKQTSNTSIIRFFLRISATAPLWQLKRNTTFYSWLKEKNCFLRTHGFSTTYDVAAAGFLSKMSPTYHRRDTINKVIQDTVKAKAPHLEIRLVPRSIPYGKDAAKTSVTAVEVQVDRAHVNQVRELMVEIFANKPSTIPQDIYFVPSPANGAMPFELYYQHLSIHHHYTADLRSFAITNVHDLQAQLTLTDTQTGDQTTVTFEHAILTAVAPDTTDRLFVSIEPTKTTQTEGRYLLVTTRTHLDAAQKYIDAAIPNTTAANMARITKNETTSITRANRIATSSRFQSYATTLQQMVPSTITTNPPPINAWKRRSTNPTLNLTDANYPALDVTKKQKLHGEVAMTETCDTLDATETLTTIDLDEIENAQKALRADLEKQIADLRHATEEMQQQMKATFAIQMGQLELRIEKNTKTMLADLSNSFQTAVYSMTDQAARSEQLFHTFKSDVTFEISQQFETVLAAIHAHTSGATTPKTGSSPTRPSKVPRNAQQNPTNLYPDQADGSLNPTASRAITPTTGSRSSAGATK
jgi:hypothetical protein